MTTYTTKQIKDAIDAKLLHSFGRDRSEGNVSREYMFRAAAQVLRDIMSQQQVGHSEQNSSPRQVHYLSMEFLVGRSLMKNAFNLGVLPQLTEAFREMGFEPADVFETEPDAGLGNGGLGRLAACYIESMTTMDIPATGYSICYELGIFRQKIVDGQQMELPDNWMELGDSWLLPRMDEIREVRFGGHVDSYWDESGRMRVRHEDYTPVLAVPKDMLIAGYGTDRVNTLRLWDAKSPSSLDMSLFSRGEYLRAIEQRAMAEVLAKVLYPDDNHYEGKSLRLKQQYFFVSATVQSIVADHVAAHGTVHNFARHHVLQINDTHPALVVPELMRILMDEHGLGWDEAWEIVGQCVAYTNHTVLSEALERWPQGLVEYLLPRIWNILQEINNRYIARLTRELNGDMSRVSRMAVIWDGEVRMANLCICACASINGVSALHSEILRKDLFVDAASMTPERFKNVTNGIDHRRWLAQSNPGLDGLIRDLTGGDAYLTQPNALKKLERYADDKSVLQRLDAIKQENKLRFAEYMKKSSGIILNTDAVFDVQVKRLHEYKRQLLNVMHICYLYNQLRDDPNRPFLPRTFIFGAKAAAGYAVAKRIIRLICSLSQQINNDPICKGKLQVVFLENYRVSLAEQLMPASEVSEQISTAGKEASGTGNMKFMMNGALTIGTLDGANVEIFEAVGAENMFLFGMTADEVAAKRPSYDPNTYFYSDGDIRRVLERFSSGFDDGISYSDLTQRLLFGAGSRPDEYMLLADFASYRDAHARLAAAYPDRDAWNRSALLNIARSGIFAADRSIRDYADTIWFTPHK